MPCDSSYMEATDLEVKISQVACLLDEIAGKEYRPQGWDGYHPRVYCQCSRELADALTRQSRWRVVRAWAVRHLIEPPQVTTTTHPTND